MLKLFLRNYVLFVIVITLVVVSGIWYSSITDQRTQNDNATLVVKGVFSYIQEHLEGHPHQDWPDILKSIAPAKANPIIILRQDQLPKNIPDQKGLMAGKVVADYRHIDLTNPLNSAHIAGSPHAYQRIGNTHYFLSYALFPPQVLADKRQAKWIGHIVLRELAKVPESQWPTVMTKFEDRFGFPVTLTPYTSLKKPIQTTLDEYGFFLANVGSDNVQVIYFQTSDKAQVLGIGPMSDSFLTRYDLYLSIATALAALFIIVLIGTLPFYKALGRLFTMANEYGNGNFTYQTKISKRLALYPLYQNLCKMGERIHQLIDSHKALTGAVSHEIRTPLARMRFATEMLESATPEERQKYLDQLNSDITELDELVGELLTHSRLDRQGLSLNHQPLPAKATIKTLYDDFANRLTDKKWAFNSNINDAVRINIDHTLFKKALNNILLNAYQYASEEIHVSLNQQDNQLIITTEDDGPGVDKADQPHIFEPFYRADASRNKKSGGHGIGLSVASKAIVAHQGTVVVRNSSSLSGACFIVTVPVAPLDT